MPAWPGGPCPSCGMEMPPNLVHCQECRRLLNDELEPDSVEIPSFVPLQEIAAMHDAEPRGHYCRCPACAAELRINAKYVGVQVQCKFCDSPFLFALTDPKIEVTAHYYDCPHCEKEIRAAAKYVGTRVACKFCSGHIQLVERLAQST